MNSKLIIQKAIASHVNVIQNLGSDVISNLLLASNEIIKSLKRDGKLILFGNGGSAADAQHISAEFTGRYVKERNALPAIALTTDTSAISAIANDYSYDRVFERQMEAIGFKGDVALGISTSGNSLNVMRALERAKEQGLTTIAFLGNDGGEIKSKVDLAIVVDSNVTARIQEVHILFGHLICELVDESFE